MQYIYSKFSKLIELFSKWYNTITLDKELDSIAREVMATNVIINELIESNITTTTKLANAIESMYECKALESYLYSMAKASRCMVWITGKDNKLKLVNNNTIIKLSKFIDIIGYSWDELEAMSIDMCKHSDKHTCDVISITELIEPMLKNKDKTPRSIMKEGCFFGESMIINIRIHPIYDLSDEFIGFCGVMNEVSSIYKELDNITSRVSDELVDIDSIIESIDKIKKDLIENTKDNIRRDDG